MQFTNIVSTFVNPQNHTQQANSWHHLQVLQETPFWWRSNQLKHVPRHCAASISSASLFFAFSGKFSRRFLGRGPSQICEGELTFWFFLQHWHMRERCRTRPTKLKDPNCQGLACYSQEPLLTRCFQAAAHYRGSASLAEDLVFR